MLEIFKKWINVIEQNVNINNTSDKTNSQEQKPQEPKEEVKPTSSEPEIIYNGSTAYTLGLKDHAKFSVYVCNIASTKDYTIEPYGNPTFISYDLSVNKTSNGYRLDFDVKACNYGEGRIKVYLTKDRQKAVTISFKIK